jgi:hypothetical protein
MTAEVAQVPMGQAHVRLVPGRLAPRRAKRLVRNTCAGAGLPTVAVEHAALIIGEFVTTSARQQQETMDVSVSIGERDITVRIHDHGTTPPVNSADEMATSPIWDAVRRLSCSWGYSAGLGERELWASVRHHPAELQSGGA